MFFRVLPAISCRLCIALVVFALVLTVSATGCKTFDPSQWSQEQVTKEVSEQWDLVSVDLKPADGGYTGTGKNAEGETFQITVRLDPAAKSATFEGKGDRGTDLDYSVRAETVR